MRGAVTIPTGARNAQVASEMAITCAKMEQVTGRKGGMKAKGRTREMAKARLGIQIIGGALQKNDKKNKKGGEKIRIFGKIDLYL